MSRPRARSGTAPDNVGAATAATLDLAETRERLELPPPLAQLQRLAAAASPTTGAEHLDAALLKLLAAAQAEILAEGGDLPASLCEQVLIDRIPFAPPDSPVEEALSEWLQAQGRDPFSGIAVPASA